MAQFQDYSIPSVLDASVRVSQDKQLQRASSLGLRDIFEQVDKQKADAQAQRDAELVRQDNALIRQDNAQKRADAATERQKKLERAVWERDALHEYQEWVRGGSSPSDMDALEAKRPGITGFVGPIIKGNTEAKQNVLANQKVLVQAMLDRMAGVMAAEKDGPEALAVAWEQARKNSQVDLGAVASSIPVQPDMKWLRAQVTQLDGAKAAIAAADAEVKAKQEREKAAPKAATDLYESAWQAGNGAKTQDDWNAARQSLLELGANRGAVDRVMPPVFTDRSVERLNSQRLSGAEASAHEDRMAALRASEAREAAAEARRDAAEAKKNAPPRPGNPGGRGVTSGDVGRLTAIDNSVNEVLGLKGVISGAGETGPLAALGKFIPDALTAATETETKKGWGAESKIRQAIILRGMQIIGTAMERGVLRKEDEKKYTDMLPKLTDSRLTAIGKIEELEREMASARRTFLENLESAGFDVSRFPETRAAPPRQTQQQQQTRILQGAPGQEPPVGSLPNDPPPDSVRRQLDKLLPGNGAIRGDGTRGWISPVPGQYLRVR